MKYIITESKLDKVIFKYLDMKLNGIEKRKGEHVDIIFTFPNEDYGMLGWKKPGYLYVSHELRDEIKNMFGLESSDVLNLIARYVEDRHNLEVIHTQSWYFLS
jgi:hypothetical protein